MAENTLALIRYLSSSVSPLPKLQNHKKSKPQTVFYSHLGLFIVYSFTQARLIYGALLILACAYIFLWDPRRTAGLRGHTKGALAIFAGLFGALLVPNLVALVMRYGLDKGLSWFKDTYAVLALYGPAALLGAHSFCFIPFLVLDSKC